MKNVKGNRKVEKTRKTLKNNLGITLIALVITIIVLLILAGVSIAMLTGENGIITQARKAKNETAMAQLNETNILENYEDTIYNETVDILQVTDSNPGVLEGNGIEQDPYTINSIEDLVAFADNVTNGNTYQNQYVRLSLSLDFNATRSYVDSNRENYYGYEGKLKTSLTTGEGFKSIGTLDKTFNGIFDGNGNSINNIYINKEIRDGDNYQGYGLFGNNEGLIKNLNVTANIKLTSYANNILVGLIAGLNNGIMQNCLSNGEIYIEGYQDKGYMAVGGIAGQINSSGIIEKCGNTATIIGKGKTNYTGGIVGSNNNQVINSYNTGKLQINKNAETYTIWTGGITGYTGKGKIEQCYNIAQIVSDGYVGAICGTLGGSGEVSAVKCKYDNENLEGIGWNSVEAAIQIEKDTDLNIEEILDILNRR